ncbi:helix-turn-helix transcriptional regulator [Caulobacter mirabilis]|nr:LuxR C-terminal-related transcriptional regulator [Caulobacter mirabilis]
MIEAVETKTDPTPFSSDVANAVLNRLTFGVVVVDEAARILSANEQARLYLDVGDGVLDEAGRLAAEIGFESETLRRRIAAAAETGRSDAALLRRSRSAKPLVILIEPAPALTGERAVLVTIREVGRASPRVAERARQLFHFSPAEAEIVARVVQGLDTAEIAAERQVSINTLRVQVASAMVKVGVHRQAELVSVLSSVDMLD